MNFTKMFNGMRMTKSVIGIILLLSFCFIALSDENLLKTATSKTFKFSASLSTKWDKNENYPYPATDTSSLKFKVNLKDNPPYDVSKINEDTSFSFYMEEPETGEAPFNIFSLSFQTECTLADGQDQSSEYYKEYLKIKKDKKGNAIGGSARICTHDGLSGAVINLKWDSKYLTVDMKKVVYNGYYWDFFEETSIDDGTYTFTRPLNAQVTFGNVEINFVCNYAAKIKIKSIAVNGQPYQLCSWKLSSSYKD